MDKETPEFFLYYQQDNLDSLVLSVKYGSGGSLCIDKNISEFSQNYQEDCRDFTLQSSMVLEVL